MLIETAEVVESRGDTAVVKTFRSEACHHCAAKGACGVMGGGKEMRVEVLNYPRASAGDRVELALPESSFVKASAASYMLPLAFIVVGAFLGNAYGPNYGFTSDTAAIVLAAAGLALAIPLIIRINRRLKDKEHYIPRIIRILPRTVEELDPEAAC